jgi:signal transduction histidine kinase
VRLDVAELVDAEAEGDPLWLRQILVNLVNNAIKYTPAGGSVTLTLTVDKGRKTDDGRTITSVGPTLNTQHPTPSPEARISVADTGPGIPAEHLPHLFDRFYRVDSGRSRDAGGVGLGLNIAKWAAEAHDGRIEVESKPGKGSVFSLVLPARAEIIAEAETAAR